MSQVFPPRHACFTFIGDGRVPNSRLPLLLYRGVVKLDENDPAAAIERLFTENGWTGLWRDGIYPFHHYHSTAHEALGIARGKALVRFGGENGRDVEVEAGDVVVIPAGVGHKRQLASDDFLVVGAYPPGVEVDLIKADPAGYTAAAARIAQVPMPATDPVTGRTGGLTDLYRA
ncbi:cupin domain-containing protein [Chelatococcus sp. GCM10030263]|uniref:cupin domain-containing protein n=1 Tax=Chelatococcus sp. GCM10030263 TaxID=3273387 RepID=UPI00361DAD15